MTVRVVSAPWVLVGRERDGASGPGLLRDGAVALDGDAILGGGPREELEPCFGRAERLDAVLLPALVNAHLHLELSHMAGAVAGGEGLAPWIQLLIAARAVERHESVVPQAMIMASGAICRSRLP